MDKARQKTDKKLTQMEKDMGKVYNDLALVEIQKELTDYMDTVYKQTEPLFKAFKESDEENIKENKRAYTEAVKTLTIGNKTYNNIAQRYVKELARVNQKALDIANATMRGIYVDNYNQVAVECKRVGIKVNE